ncbi:hypothetical protein [Gelidibacter japonicus]|uniref:hypothetical protein n=1 Tax=Gelidibacter japonicus TaxID=1962232 RepID=UPI002AFFD239|nr:hypothetical protein [Gelidibacter japonicus]
MKNNLLIFVILLFFSCERSKNEENSLKSYFYNIYGKDNVVKGHFKRVVYHQNDSIRIDTIYRYNKDKSLADTYIDRFLITKNGIKSTYREDYFNTKDLDSCIVYSNNNNQEFKSCFIESKSEIIINDSVFNNVSKYLIVQLTSHGLTKEKYLDEDLVLIREEYIDGYAPYYRIDRVKNIDN